MRLPGLIDPHVHMREPGADHKEDWSSGTAAALAGGYTQVLAMPNTHPPVVRKSALEQVMKIASQKAYCDFAQYYGAAETNMDEIAVDAEKCAGLKLYLDQTYGPLRLDGMPLWLAHFKSWPMHRPLVAHAEGHTLAAAILMSALADRPLHLAHVATKEEILLVREAKERGLKITCEVTPHHLLLTESDIAGGRGEVRPRLGTNADVEALWKNMDVIDCIATDHAPHTLAEKDGSESPPGFPGLETALPLMLEEVHRGRITLDALIPRLSTNVRRIFGVPEQGQTYVEVDLGAETVFSGRAMLSKAGWTPFEGWRTHGKVCSVVLRGENVYKDGKVLAQPGAGRPIFQ